MILLAISSALYSCLLEIVADVSKAYPEKGLFDKYFCLLLFILELNSFILEFNSSIFILLYDSIMARLSFE